MKTVIFFSMVLICSIFTEIMAQIPSSPPASGDGTSGNPYVISSLDNLRWIAENSSRWNKYYVQTNDINASATGMGGAWGTEGWAPIGAYVTAFTGSYNGNGYTISGLYINRPNSDLVGLFGNIKGPVSNIIINANITGEDEVGILAGSCGSGGSISKCFTSGSATATGEKVGGCIGWVTDGITVRYSGSSANVSKSSATNDIGGFVGYCLGNFYISDCYSVGSVMNDEPYCGGGFVGRINDNSMQGRVIRCFSNGYVSNEYGGFLGSCGGRPPIKCFWDNQTSQAIYSDGGTEKTTPEMKNLETFTNLTADAWDFIGNYFSDLGIEEIWNLDGTTNNGYPFLSWQTHAWTGAESSDWDDPDNWLSGSVPDGSNTVSISLATNSPQLYMETASCQNLIISSQNQLHMLGGHLTVSGSLVNNGDEDNLILDMEPEYAWSTLIHNNPDVKAKFGHTINAAQWETWDDGWHLLSSPIAGSPIGEWHTPGSGGDLEGDFYSWDEAANLWINRTLESGLLNPEFETNFVFGKGYLVAVKNSLSEYFTGSIIASDIITMALSHEANGWNLVGNPFPSSIKWNDGNWNLDGFGAVAQVWEEASKDYVPLEANDIIPPCQGFMIYTAVSQMLTIPKSARTHDLVTWYKQGKENQRIMLIAHDSMGASAKRTVIKMNADATPGFDLKYDAFFLSGYAPKFFSIAEEDYFSVNTLPVINDETVIPLGFIKNNSTDFSIELAEKIDELPVILVDTKTGIEHDFSKGRYNFASTEKDPVNRFFIKFGHLGINDCHVKDKTDAWVYAGQLFINQQTEITNVEIFDVTGRCIRTWQLQSTGLKKVSLNSIPRGVYLIRMTNENGITVIKVNV